MQMDFPLRRSHFRGDGSMLEIEDKRGNETEGF